MLHTHQSSQVLDRSQVFIFLQMSINNYSDNIGVWKVLQGPPQHDHAWCLCLVQISSWSSWSITQSSDPWDPVNLCAWSSDLPLVPLLLFSGFETILPPPLILIVVERGMIMIEYARWLTWWWSGWWWSMWRERLKEMRKSCYFLVIKPVSGSNLKR